MDVRHGRYRALPTTRLTLGIIYMLLVTYYKYYLYTFLVFIIVYAQQYKVLPIPMCLQ